MIAALLRRGCAAVFAALCLQLTAAQASDVPYVPTSMNVVDAMLGLAGVGPGDYLVDLGSGDGRISIRAATRFGTRGFGVDIEDRLVRMATADARKQGVADKVVFEARNLFGTDISRASVVTAYLLPSINQQLRPLLFEQLKPGTRVVSHDFDFGAWLPDQKITIDVPDKPYGPPRSDIMLWVMPANFSGMWRWSLPGGGTWEARFEQKFQALVGAATAQGRPLRLVEPRIKGETVSFTLAGEGVDLQRYAGRIDGNSISGEVVLRSGEPALPWRAERVNAGKINIGDATDAVRRVADGSLIKER